MARLRPVYSLLGVFTIALAGCTKQEATPEPAVAAAPPPPALPPAPAVPAAQSAETASAAPAPAPEPPKPVPLTDEQIVKVVETVNAAEIDQGKVAQKKAKNAKVKKFAGQMVTDHTQAKNKAAAWVKKAKITPADSPVATELISKTTQSLETLKGTEADFDEVYVDSQIRAHQELLDVLDKELLPSVEAPDLKKYLEDTRALVEKHLTHAKELQGVLAAAPPPAAAKPAAGAAAAPAAPATPAPAAPK